MTTAIANQVQVQQLHVGNSHLTLLRTLARQMPIPTLIRLRSPSLLQWWEWGQVLGTAGLVALATLLMAGYVLHPAAVAVLLHVAADFAFQSTETALRKGERGRHLLVHALVAGGLPLAVAGLVTGYPVAVVTWAAAGAASHYALDWTRKFGLRQVAAGVVLAQACHLLTILVLVLAG